MRVVKFSLHQKTSNAECLSSLGGIIKFMSRPFEIISDPEDQKIYVRSGTNISWLKNLFQYLRRWFSKKCIDATLNTFKTVLISLILNQSMQEHNIIVD